MGVKIFATELWPFWLALVYRLSAAAVTSGATKPFYCSANDRELHSHQQSFDWHVEPLDCFLPIFENTNIDRRTLSQYSVQPCVMNHCRIGSKNRLLDRRMARIGKASTQRDLNDVFEIEFNFI